MNNYNNDKYSIKCFTNILIVLKYKCVYAHKMKY